MPRVPRLERSESIDIGGRIPRADASGFGKIGEALTEFGGALSSTANAFVELRKRESERQQRLADANFKTERTAQVTRELTQDFQRRLREGDPSDPQSTSDFETFSNERIAGALAEQPKLPDGSPAVSEQAVADLNARLKALQTRFLSNSLRTQQIATDEKAFDALNAGFNRTAAMARRNPAILPKALVGIDAMTADYEGALNANVLRDLRADARGTIIGAVVRRLIDRGDIAGAREVLENKTFDEEVAPGRRAELLAKIAVTERRIETRAREQRNETDLELGRRVNDVVFVLERGKVPAWRTCAVKSAIFRNWPRHKMKPFRTPT